MMLQKLLELIFPRKCVLCQELLKKDEENICPLCIRNLESFSSSRYKLKYITKWTALWHYENHVRQSIIRYKFSNRPSYGSVYGTYLTEKILQEGITFDMITSVPLSKKRMWKRGYDHTRIIAEQIAVLTAVPYAATLVKSRHTKPQSLLRTAAERRANILGSYTALSRETIQGKNILLIDDVVTTGATVSECARVLLTMGAKTVSCAAVASAFKKTK